MATILVIGLIAGWKAVNQAVNNELEDVGNAISSLDQSYRFGGVSGCCAETKGSFYRDTPRHGEVDTCEANFQPAAEGCEEGDGR